MQFSRTVAPDTSKGPALIAFMQQNNWSKIVIISSTESVFFETRHSLWEQLEAAGIDVLKPTAFETENFKNATLREIKKSGIRIVLILSHETDVHAVASLGRRESMTTGWAWLFMNPWVVGVKDMAGWLLFRPFLGSDMQAFAKQVSDYSKSHFNITVRPDSVLIPYSVALYDAVMLYAHAATTVMSDGGDLHDGQALTNAIQNATFDGVEGSTVALSQDGDRIESHEVVNYWHGEDNSLVIVPVGLYNSLLKQYTEYTRAVVWPGGINQVPLSFIDPVPCKYGEFLNALTDRCAACPAGQYQVFYRHGRNSCERCSPGMFSGKQGEASCQRCSAQPGKYQPDSGQRECLACRNRTGDATDVGTGDAYSTIELGSINASSCLCSVNRFTHSNKHIECVHCLVGASCSGFDRQTGTLFAPVALSGFYGLRMRLRNDDGTQLSRYVFHKCKPGRCLEVTASVPAADENSHVQKSFSNLSVSTNLLSRCAKNLEGFACHKCMPGSFRLLPSWSTCNACFLQDAKWLVLGKILSLTILLFLLFGFVPLIRRIRTAIPSRYSIIPFLQIFALMKAQLGTCCLTMLCTMWRQQGHMGLQVSFDL